MHVWKTRVLYLFAGIGVLFLAGWIVLAVYRAHRPPAPPSGRPLVYPWGSMNIDDDQDEADSDLEESIEESVEDEAEGSFDPDRDGKREYSILVLSGGGSAGAFGAGLLNGWTASGTRPDFKVVTGVSVGSLQSTFAFLGPEYDDDLREVCTDYDTDHIYSRRNLLGATLGESAFDNGPLRELIERYITPEVLEKVARKHERGYRLYVGTSNMDTREFIIWDMGAIASSKREGKLERYRKVLLASSAIPVLFPPVYFAVQIDGETYYEMHADGGTRSQLFLRGFMLDFQDTLEEENLARTTETSVYILRNGRAGEESSRDLVGASSVSIASATIHSALDLSSESSLFRVYSLSVRYGIDFNFAAIPDDLFPELDPVIFDLEIMKGLYDHGFAKAKGGYPWAKSPPGIDQDEWPPGEVEDPVAPAPATK